MLFRSAMSEKVRDSRKRKAIYFMKERAAFMAETVFHIRKLKRKASESGLQLCVRLNGSSDIAFEGIAVEIDGKRFRNLFEAFPEIQFVDYTKNPHRFARKLPENYHLTFSLSEKNEPIARKLIARGVNVAAVFGSGLPDTYLGAMVLNGDLHDLRHLDPKGGFIIGLSPKGNRAKRDLSGFVIRDYQTLNA